MIDDGVAAAMIALTSLETAYAPGVVVKRSRAFIRLIRKLLQNTRDYESSVRLALDYDVNDRIRIGMYNQCLIVISIYIYITECVFVEYCHRFIILMNMLLFNRFYGMVCWSNRTSEPPSNEATGRILYIHWQRCREDS